VYFMNLMMLLFLCGIPIALLVWGIFKLIKHENSTTKQTPVEIVKERYAKGEITKEQFEQIKKDLS
jgi:putative membrane protein